MNDYDEAMKMGADDDGGNGAGDEAHTKPTSGLHATDLGNASRFVNRHGAIVRYCHPWNRWLVQNGKHWARDDSGRALALAKETALAIYAEAAAETDDDRRKFSRSTPSLARRPSGWPRC